MRHNLHILIPSKESHTMYCTTHNKPAEVSRSQYFVSYYAQDGIRRSKTSHKTQQRWFDSPSTLDEKGTVNLAL